MTIFHAARRVLAHLPSQCAICRTWPTDPVCGDCTARFCLPTLRCGSCAVPLPTPLLAPHCLACIKRSPSVAHTLVAVDYAYPWSDLIASFKFGGSPGWADFFARLLLAQPQVQAAFSALGADDFVVPIPLSPERLQMRGFNQSWELTKALAALSNTQAQVRSDLLLRIRDTPAQTALKRDDRFNNVKYAFLVAPLLAGSLRDKRVLIVDDVITSGATLFEAANAINSCAAAQVNGVAIARTAPE